ncbi:MAG: hypothetical protein HOP29_11630 [Phycisphaerales bacterium]|nr:hypothetical protein [Phycisphaerales bacterium]
MTEHERLIAEIEHDERWLRSFESPVPDRVTVECVKIAVRLAAGFDAAAVDARGAIRSAKAAVRRAIDGDGGGSALPPVILRLWGPVGVLAAAVALAFSVLWGDVRSNEIRDPDLAAFVAVMSQPPDATLTTLLEMEDAILGLTELDASGGADAWGLPLLNDDSGFDGEWWTNDGGSGSS